MSSDDDSQAIGPTLLQSHERRLNMHAQRLRTLEDFRLLHQQTETLMKEALKTINQHLERQDNTLEVIRNKMSKWGGMITVIVAIPAAIITIVEAVRLFK